MKTYAIGQLLGFITLGSLTLQVVLASRIRWLDRLFGLNRLMTWHRYNAYLMLTAVLVHPFLVFYRTLLPNFYQTNLLSIFKFFTLPIWLGEAAVAVILFTLIFTLLAQKFNWDYQRWRFLHKVGYLAVILGFTHSYLIGSHIITRGIGFYLWVLLAGIFLGAFTYRYLWGWWRSKNYLFEVTKIERETHDVHSIWLKPLKETLTWQAGQFAFVTFESPHLPREEHHFTISSAPSQQILRFTIKESGDFTSQLGKLQVGDRARIDGPYGSFTLDLAKNSRKLLFIAGGIGITPIMSILEEIAANLNKTTLDDPVLIYANKTHRDIVFKERLEKLSSALGLKIIHVLSQEKRKGYLHGYVTKEIIQQQVSDVTQRKVFLVGPPPMMESVKKSLLDLKVAPKNIHQEKFSLR